VFETVLLRLDQAVTWVIYILKKEASGVATLCS